MGNNNKFKISDFFSPEIRHTNRFNMKTTHFKLGSDRGENRKTMNKTLVDPYQLSPEQSKQHIIMANRSKKVHFKKLYFKEI